VSECVQALDLGLSLLDRPPDLLDSDTAAAVVGTGPGLKVVHADHCERRYELLRARHDAMLAASPMGSYAWPPEPGFARREAHCAKNGWTAFASGGS